MRSRWQSYPRPSPETAGTRVQDDQRGAALGTPLAPEPCTGLAGSRTGASFAVAVVRSKLHQAHVVENSDLAAPNVEYLRFLQSGEHPAYRLHRK